MWATEVARTVLGLGGSAALCPGWALTFGKQLLRSPSSLVVVVTEEWLRLTSFPGMKCLGLFFLMTNFRIPPSLEFGTVHVLCTTASPQEAQGL